MKSYLFKLTALAFFFAASFFLGSFLAARTAKTPSVDPEDTRQVLAASTEGNWGLSFQAEGQTPVGNATAEELAQYDAWYAGSFRRKDPLSNL